MLLFWLKQIFFFLFLNNDEFTITLISQLEFVKRKICISVTTFISFSYNSQLLLMIIKIILI